MVVPFMALAYLLVALYVCAINFTALPDVLVLIIKSAFGIEQAGAGAIGYGVTQAMIQGIKRGLFSNEAGMGSAANAAATATPYPPHPASQGYVQMLGVFIDTIVICTATASLILLSQQLVPESGVMGIELTQAALQEHVGDWGTYFIAIAILFFAGISFVQFLLLASLMIGLAASAVFFSAYRYARLISFTDPFAYFDKAGWQLGNALLGIGRGEWFGVGLGNGIQKNLYLPEPHTDFIFAVLVEEFGVTGSLVLLALYAALIIGIFRTAIKAIELGRLFEGLIAFGAAVLIAVQALFNIGVNLGILPTKGLTLPFISYGGTSLILFMFMIGMVLRINHDNRSIK